MHASMIAILIRSTVSASTDAKAATVSATRAATISESAFIGMTSSYSAGFSEGGVAAAAGRSASTAPSSSSRPKRFRNSRSCDGWDMWIPYRAARSTAAGSADSFRIIHFRKRSG